MIFDKWMKNIITLVIGNLEMSSYFETKNSYIL